MAGMLEGIRVVDLSVNAPGPFASLVLADLGASVIAIGNPAQGNPQYAGADADPMLSSRGGPSDALQRGKTRQALDLKSPSGREALLALVAESDILLSEMRPGKLEALGLGYAVLSARNPRIILCEISGYGKHHPLAARAGHDINYLARSGALSLIRDRDDRPVVPQNLIADYAAGGSLAVNAILAALYARERTGRGRQLSLSMTTGVQYLMADIAAATLLGGHPVEDWQPTLNGGMPTYDVYQCADGRWLAVGALEPKFIAILGAALEWPTLADLMADKTTWGKARAGLEQRFSARTRDSWAEHFDGLDACVSPVLELEELDSRSLPGFSDVLS